MLRATPLTPAGEIVPLFTREVIMRKPQVDDYVRLTQDIPELSLNRGQVGVVRSTWFHPTVAYEVEFHLAGMTSQTRALLLVDQVAVEEGSLAEANA